MLNFLVQDILDFAQIKENKFRKNIQNFDLKESIQEVVNVQQYKAEQLGINVSVEVDGGKMNAKNKIAYGAELSDICNKVNNQSK